VKTGGRLITHTLYYWMVLAESYSERWLSGDMMHKIAAFSLIGGLGKSLR
jgi:hypothetical protein